MSFDYDLVVLGCGAAGEKGAARAAFFGKRVAIVELAPELGGACTNTGTLPSKTLRESVLNYPTLSELYKYAAYDALGQLLRQN